MSQIGASIQSCSSLAPAMVSTPTVMIQKYQYSHPVLKPAHGPRLKEAYSAKDPIPGRARAISPSMRMIRKTSSRDNA